ncbi:MAG: hypothetical protein SFT94_09035 [Pseudanabaenaceae cyanobacterium bins.68]|nr:hypothetical protein [Pseudanabaenaceae cyanobacterium bins.68]
MNSDQVQYETLLSQYCDQLEAIKLLRQYRPYFEMIPSLRRPTQSLICLPLPVVKLEQPQDAQPHVALAADLGLLMCDPEWKIKTGREIFIFIHRPGEDFSQLLSRWRQVEIILGCNYYWLLPWKYQHIMAEKGEAHYPLFVTLSYTPSRIIKGLAGCSLPTISVSLNLADLESETFDQLERSLPADSSSDYQVGD